MRITFLGAAHEVTVELGEKLGERTEAHLSHAVEDLLVALLGLDALLGVALTVAEAEQFLEAVLKVQLTAQPKPLANGMATALPSFTWAKV